ncbi:MAG: BMP family ABC transporter substrate-binding protein [Actinobacteria bacterium]|nr:BMP family ABC transporter substrate-binding protein [Actinomycetota bacterium]
MKTTTRALAAIAAAALLATGCGSAPEVAEEPEETSTATEPAGEATTDEATEATDADYLACQVTDTGGVDDRSFNQTAYKGLQDAESQLGIEIQVLESQSEADFEPNINQFVSQGCDLIVTVGFLLGEATEGAAQANPDTDFAIVDFAYETEYDNLLGLTFETDQAAFLAGYVAAATTETGTVGTYGGINIPPVTIFMDGFLAGVRYHNQEKGTEVEVLGWDGTDGLFTGDFSSQDKGRQTTDQLLQAGADIIMPVAGPVGLGSAAAIEEAGRGKLIWVDTDGFESASQFSELMLTSVMKNMDVAVFTAIERGVNGEFEGGVYSGTLENDGVGLAPFHDFEDEVPQETKDELEKLREGIISGEISVKPADYS